MSEATLYSCKHPQCAGKAGKPAEQMWNTKGKPGTILCGTHGHDARKAGLRVYRLSDSLAYEQKIAREREESRAFFMNLQSQNREKGRNVKRADWATA